MNRGGGEGKMGERRIDSGRIRKRKGNLGGELWYDDGKEEEIEREEHDDDGKTSSMISVYDGIDLLQWHGDFQSVRYSLSYTLVCRIYISTSIHDSTSFSIEQTDQREEGFQLPWFFFTLSLYSLTFHIIFILLRSQNHLSTYFVYCLRNAVHIF